MTDKEMFGEARWVSPGSGTDTPCLRKVFESKGGETGRITICGLGFFELYINGHRVNEEVFVPVNSDYHPMPHAHCVQAFGEELRHRIYCMTFDISEWLREGDNCIGVMLGPGYYASEPRYGDVKACWAIELIDKDSGVRRSDSDETVKWAQGPVLTSDFYRGETQDDNYRMEGWMEPEYEDAAWHAVEVVPAPDSEYYLQDCPADRVIRHCEPILIQETDTHRLYDVGENISGYPIIRCDSRTPQAILLRVGEERAPEGGLEEARVHWQQSRFQTDGTPRRYHTRFTWNAFRYVEVTKNAVVEDCAVVHSAVAVTSTFSSGQETLNWLYEAYLRTQLCNMHGGIPSDCPHLERHGYTGDGQLTCEAAMLLLDGQAFYRKWIRDISDCQDRHSGHVQYTAPYFHAGGGPGGWGCAIVEVPYVYYRQYGDTQVLEELYPQMLRYFDYLDAHSEEDLVVSDQPGLWCLGDWCTPEPIQIPEPLVNTYYYVKSLHRVMEIATILDRPDDIVDLALRAQQKSIALVKQYYDPETGDFAGNVQGANAFMVDLGLGDERTLHNMVSRYESSGMYDTGIFGTDVVTRVLFERGYGQLAYDLLTSEGQYSFANWKRQGATTLWEYWTGERSHSHPMFGAVSRYLFQYLLGIRQRPESAGYQSIEIAPYPIPELSHIKGSIMTPRGEIRVEIRRKDGKARFQIHVEPNVQAEFSYGTNRQRLEAGDHTICVNEIG